MALGDRQVLASQVAAGNSDYVIPGAVSLQLKAVQALFTDNGAGGDWLPAVVAVSDSGHVFWRAVDQGVKVTAGDDAEVSWFPGVKHAAAATSGGIDRCTGATTIPYVVTATGGVQNFAVPWDSVLPASGTFAWPVAGDATKIAVNGSGWYALFYSHVTVASWPAPAAGFIVSSANMATFGQGFISEDFFLNTTTTALFAGTGGRSIVGVQQWNLPSADVMTLFLGNSTAGNFNMERTAFVLARLGDYIAGGPI